MVLPQRHRLRGRGLFDYLYQQGRRFHRGLLLLRVAPANPQLLSHHGTSSPTSEELRFAVVVSTKVSKRSVVRNRLRRRLHEAFVQAAAPATRQFPSVMQSHWLLLSLKPGAADLSDDELLREWNALLHQAGLIDDRNPDHAQ